jgi:hypothetical protein
MNFATLFVGPHKMLSCVLLDLPEALSRLIFVEWLYVLKHVVRLDSAFCSHQLREQYRTLAYGKCMRFTLSAFHQLRTMDGMLTWTISRGVQLDGVFLNSSAPCGPDLLSEFLAVSGSAVEWINFGHFMDNTTNQNIVLEVVKCCPNVRKLEAYGGGPWDVSLPVLTHAFRRLTVMTLVDAKLSKQCLAAALIHCRYLEQLEIRTCSDVPVEVALQSLKSLAICYSELSDEILCAIGQHCAGLERLWVFESSDEEGYAVTDVGVRAVLQGCPLLRETDVEYAAGLSTELRVELARRRNFRQPYLRRWSDMTNDLALGVVSVSPNLVELDCWRCAWLTDAMLAACAFHCPRMETIILSGCPLITDYGVHALVARQGARLLAIRLDECTQLSDETVLAIGQHCWQLQSVHCPPKLSDAAVVALAQGCSELTNVNITHAMVTDTGIAALARHCPGLKYVCLAFCPHITAEGARMLIEHCPNLLKIALPTRLCNQQHHLRAKPLTAVCYPE